MIRHLFFILFALLVLATGCFGPVEDHLGNNLVALSPEDNEYQILMKASEVAPSERQLTWQEYELTAFVHFTINTFTDKEWGDGTENPEWFNPTELDARQWARVCKEAGMKLIIVTAKHHDGFCLWPTEQTDHSVEKSPWKNGRGDVVREVAEACREYGLKFGVYLSPWDRHEGSYGTEAYNDFFKAQLRELLTQYGDVAEVWFDGANGEGPNGKRQVYDWEGYFRLIRELQPNAVIAIMGPDVRWVGTESGYGRDTEWSVVPANNLNQEQIAEASQQHILVKPEIDAMEEDLGSREKIKNARALAWYPSEVDVSIRPGWFYHASQDAQVKSPEKLIDIYYSSVGRNSVLLLNIPPDRRGLIHENDIASLQGFRRILDETFSENLMQSARVIPDVNTNIKRSSDLYDGRMETCWASKASQGQSILEFRTDGPVTFDVLSLQENIRAGQRIESFLFEVWMNDAWVTMARGTTIGYKRILRIPRTRAERMRIVIESARMRPTLGEVGLYLRPPDIQIKPSGGVFVDSLVVQLTSSTPDATIHYTMDGSVPNDKSPVFNGPLVLKETTDLKAVAMAPGPRMGWYKTAYYTQSEYGISFDFPASQRYDGGSNLALLDGRYGSRAYDDGFWTGFEGWDMHATVDLGSITPIENIGVRFLQDIDRWIFLPISVRFESSMDGIHYEILGQMTGSLPKNNDCEIRIQSFESGDHSAKARYIRIIAKNIGVCPAWHPGNGMEAWLFADEITLH
jgi:alpha-L-fucosidase